jgi:hypothetical protein
MESCLKIGREYQHWLGALLYKMGKSVLYREPQHKIQSQHTTTNMSHRHPTLQRLWPSLSMATSAMDPNLGAAAPHGPIQGSRRGYALAIVGSFVRGAEMQPLKNRERGGVSTFGGRSLNIRRNNQPKVCDQGGGDIREGARSGRNVWV